MFPADLPVPHRARREPARRRPARLARSASSPRACEVDAAEDLRLLSRRSPCRQMSRPALSSNPVSRPRGWPTAATCARSSRSRRAADAQAAITGWEGYARRALRDLPAIADICSASPRLRSQGRGQALGLKSFKALGGAYAVDRLVAHKGKAGLTVARATDGQSRPLRLPGALGAPASRP